MSNAVSVTLTASMLFMRMLITKNNVNTVYVPYWSCVGDKGLCQKFVVGMGAS